jgi:dTMP kinase
MSAHGKYIVIEGAEGVGKTTVLEMVADRLRAAGLPVKVMREPESQNDLTARSIRRLTQDPRFPMSTRTEVLLYNAARSQSLEIIRESVKNGVYCLVDRSYLTTLAIQYYGRGDIKDYKTINDIIDFAVGDMYPDLMIVLDAPTGVLKERVRVRHSAERFDNLDEAFLERVRAGYLWEAKQRHLPVVYANEPVETVVDHVWQHVTDAIGKRDSKAVPQPTALGDVIQQKAQRLENTQKEKANIEQQAYVKKLENGSYEITDAGREWLKDAVTSVDGNVYATKNKLDSLTAAAAMARLSRRGDDMRVTVLDEFASEEASKDEQLLRRVITAYGDDSVQQLVSQHIVVENASNLLTKKLEWGRLAAYLEQSTRYIYFDQKDTNGNYRYYVPASFEKNVRKRYVQAMDTIFDIYSELVAKLTDHVRTNSSTPKSERDIAWKGATKAQACDAVRSLLPVATKSTVGIFASGQALEQLIMRLLADELPEAREVGQQILDEARKTIPVILERADKPERGGAQTAYLAETRSEVKKLASEVLPSGHANNSEPVTLVSYWPRNELDIVADIIYEHSDRSLLQLQADTAKLPYEKKLAIFNAYMGNRLNRRQRPGRALENIHYTWDLVCDYGIFRDLQRHRMVDDMRWQVLTPRFGYDMPKLVEEAGLVEAYEQCFALSLELHSYLQQSGYELEAQYATLLGHKMRWRVTMNAREAMHFNELRTSPQGHPGYRKLVMQMHEKLCEVHPLVGGAMKFVNSDEDPELSRLAAERYTQFKLNQLS